MSEGWIIIPGMNRFEHIYIYICIYIYTYVYTYIYIYVYTYIHTYIYIYIVKLPYEMSLLCPFFGLHKTISLLTSLASGYLTPAMGPLAHWKWFLRINPGPSQLQHAGPFSLVQRRTRWRHRLRSCEETQRHGDLEMYILWSKSSASFLQYEPSWNVVAGCYRSNPLNKQKKLSCTL